MDTRRNSGTFLAAGSAIGAAVSAVAYGVAQLLQVAGLLSDPLDRILIFAPSLALAPLFVVALGAACGQATPAQRLWRTAAVVMAGMYATLVSLVYVVQLGVVIPRELAGDGAWSTAACCAFQTPMTAQDLLGYTYMALALLLLAPTYSGLLRWLLVANGLVALVLLPQLVWPGLIWVASPWLAIFPAAMALLAREAIRS